MLLAGVQALEAPATTASVATDGAGATNMATAAMARANAVKFIAASPIRSAIAAFRETEWRVRAQRSLAAAESL
jgi:hypothetical protein